MDFILKLINEIKNRTPANLKILKQISVFSVQNSLKIHKEPISGLFNTFGINFELASKIETQWDNLLFNKWQNVNDTVAFWCEVYNFTDACNDYPYKDLAKLAISCLTLPISNASVERVFSVMN